MKKIPSYIEPHPEPLRAKIYEIIFGAETKAGKLFDILLLWAILFSVLAVILESVTGIRQNYGPFLVSLEWFFTIIFTLEYVLRIMIVKHKRRYIFSFFGLIDLLSILPSYLNVILAGSARSLMVIRALRLLRVFRILKLGRYLKEMHVLIRALKASGEKIVVFLFIVLTFALLAGTVMYLIEGEAHGFTSIPRSIYWAIVTMTTVGYGDISPETVLGQMLAACMMISGYAIIVVPAGIFSVELHEAGKKSNAGDKRTCSECKYTETDKTSLFCRICGHKF